MTLKVDNLNAFSRNGPFYMSNSYVLNISNPKTVATDSPIYSPSVLPDEVNSDRDSPILQKGNIVEVEIDLDDLIYDLKELADEKLGCTIGFHPKPRSSERLDKLIGEKADFLFTAITESKNPSYELVETAINFMNALEIVNDLQMVFKERTFSGIGLRANPPSKEDKLLGEKAEKLAIALIENLDKELLEVAYEFLRTVDIIEELEIVEEEKSHRAKIGFLTEPVSKEDQKIGEIARKLANVLKVDPSEKNLMLTYEFFKFINGEGVKRDLKPVEKKRCLGYVCEEKPEPMFGIAAMNRKMQTS